jgi:hypothetical protein
MRTMPTDMPTEAQSIQLGSGWFSSGSVRVQFGFSSGSVQLNSPKHVY